MFSYEIFIVPRSFLLSHYFHLLSRDHFILWVPTFKISWGSLAHLLAWSTTCSISPMVRFFRCLNNLSHWFVGRFSYTDVFKRQKVLFFDKLTYVLIFSKLASTYIIWLKLLPVTSYHLKWTSIVCTMQRLIFLKKNIYSFIWLPWVLVVACGIFLLWHGL